MQSMNGIDFIRHTRHIYTTNELPILALSAAHKPSIVEQLLKIGANDYNSKPIGNEEFLTRRNISLEQFRLFNENKKLIKQLKMTATTDFLTNTV